MPKQAFVPVAVVASKTNDSAKIAARDQKLIAASERGDVTEVKALLAQGADVRTQDARGRTALMAATHANQVETAALLIGAGADVNARGNIKDTPYLYAGAEGRLDILRLTLAAGADLKSTNRFGGTALIPAAEKGHVENVRELLKTKIDVNHVNDLGWTALLEVCLRQRGPAHAEITRLLLAAGANPNLADKDGVTPLAHAERNGNLEIAKLLKAAGGRSARQQAARGDFLSELLRLEAEDLSENELRRRGLREQRQSDREENGGDDDMTLHTAPPSRMSRAAARFHMTGAIRR